MAAKKEEVKKKEKKEPTIKDVIVKANDMITQINAITKRLNEFQNEFEDLSIKVGKIRNRMGI